MWFAAPNWRHLECSWYYNQSIFSNALASYCIHIWTGCVHFTSLAAVLSKNPYKKGREHNKTSEYTRQKRQPGNQWSLITSPHSFCGSVLRHAIVIRSRSFLGRKVIWSGSNSTSNRIIRSWVRATKDWSENQTQRSTITIDVHS